jgi:diguanylate cyclase
MSSYRLVRRVQQQNLRLDELTRTDGLTGLASRGHWHMQADALLQRHQAQGQSATLMLIDVDHFKDINDRHGHATGDGSMHTFGSISRQPTSRTTRAAAQPPSIIVTWWRAT